MKAPHFPGVGAAAAALLMVAASAAEAEPRVVIGGWSAPPRHHGGGLRGRHGRHGFHVPYYVVEREPTVIIEREVVREVPVIVEAPPPPPPPREPYVIGRSYASLPGGCMKLIEEGAAYYYCGGEWYRQAGKQYRAVHAP